MRDLGADQEQKYDHKVAVAHKALFGDALTDLHAGKVPHSMRSSGGFGEGVTIQKRRKPRELPGREESEWELTFLANVTQQHDGEVSRSYFQKKTLA